MQSSNGSLTEPTKKGRATLLKKKPRYIYTRSCGMRMDAFLRLLRERGDDFIYKRNMFGGEVILGSTKFIAASPDRRRTRDMKSLFLFSMVKMDALGHVAAHEIKRLPSGKQIHTGSGRKKRNGRVSAIDVNSAYWDIAFKQGVIREATHLRGKEVKDKSIVLATLAALGREKTYHVVRGGVETNDTKTVIGNKKLQDAYNKIRITCYRYMMEMANMLGNDFLEYRTDCVYFYYSKENVMRLKGFMDKKDLSYKFSEDVPEKIWK